jgi:hypothetical protein
VIPITSNGDARTTMSRRSSSESTTDQPVMMFAEAKDSDDDGVECWKSDARPFALALA